jgi:hypothetical protein
MITIEQEKLEAPVESRSRWFLTTEESANYVGRSIAWMNQQRAKGTLEPDAELKTHTRGRPPFLYRKSTLRHLFE